MSFVKSIFNFLRFNKKNWKAVALCIFAAMIFWFFNALNKNYSTNLNFPLTFDYDQERYVPVSTLPQTVRMNVNGTGWDLFRRSMGFKVSPLTIPLEQPAEVRKIVGATLPAVFAGQLERLKINFIITDTLRIQIQERVRKKFFVRMDSVQQYLHPDYGLIGEPVLDPDTVILEGPKDAINNLPDILPLTLSETSLRKDFKEAVDLNLKQGNLFTYEPQRITVTLAIEKFEQVEEKVKVNFVNVPARWKHESVHTEVTCVYRLPASAAKARKEGSLSAIIDLKDKRPGTHKLVPEIVGLPPYAARIKTDTVVVNF